MLTLLAILVFPGGLFLIANSVAYEWVDRKVVARLQNRIGPRWFQPFADLLKLLTKEEVIPEGVHVAVFIILPVIALASALTAALTLPVAGLAPVYSYPGDLIVTVYLLSLLTLCLSIAGTNTHSQYGVIGAMRILTQLFAYEAPFLLALLGPAFLTGSWQINEIVAAHGGQWLLFAQPIGFVIAVLSLMGKVELSPFDAPEAETEVVAGALTEYSGRGLALFLLGKKVVLLVGLLLISALYMGGIANPLDYIVKTLLLLLIITVIQALMARLRIDQTVGVWWHYGVLGIFIQWLWLLLQGT